MVQIQVQAVFPTPKYTIYRRAHIEHACARELYIFVTSAHLRRVHIPALAVYSYSPAPFRCIKPVFMNVQGHTSERAAVWVTEFCALDAMAWGKIDVVLCCLLHSGQVRQMHLVGRDLPCPMVCHSLTSMRRRISWIVYPCVMYPRFALLSESTPRLTHLCRHGQAELLAQTIDTAQIKSSLHQLQEGRRRITLCQRPFRTGQ